MEYDTIIVPGCETLRSSTLERLEDFRKCGGRLLFLGEAPSLCDAVASERGKALYNLSEKADYTHSAVITAMDKDRTVTLRCYDGTLTDNLIYQLREDEDCKWLFICYDKEPYNKDVENGDYVKITVDGEYSVLTYNTENGEIYPAVFTVENGKTVIDEHLYGYDSRLYKLVKAGEVASAEKNDEGDAQAIVSPGFVDYELSEENVLVLDMAEFKVEGEEEFSPVEEVLRLDNICRERLGLEERGGAVVQPWVYGAQPHVSKVTLRYKFNSEINYSGAFLALEDAEDAEIIFNGEKVPSEIKGTYVDISIFKVALPDIKKGENVLEVTYPFGPSANLEAMYLIGYFGVRVVGRYASITALPEKLAFGEILSQGLPFYSGAITYKLPVKAENGSIKVCASDYRGALISAELDGEKMGNIIYPPYELEIKDVADGDHILGVKLYIHRYNSMGPIHLVDVKESWHGPGAWRSEGKNWSYEYVLRTTGILKAPEIMG